MKPQMQSLFSLMAAATLSLGVAGLAAQTPPASSPTAKDPAQPPAMSAPAKMDKAGGADTMFVNQAAKGGMMEVAKGKLAAQKASRDDVKQFAQRMVDDHTKAGDELKSVASGKNITLPPDQPSAQDQAMLDKMGKMDGAAFDRAYIADQVKDHEKTIALFEKEARNGKDAELKAFAEKTLPTLKDHLTAVRGPKAKRAPTKHTCEGRHYALDATAVREAESHARSWSSGQQLMMRSGGIPARRACAIAVSA
jgi:putative membrane protein